MPKGAIYDIHFTKKSTAGLLFHNLVFLFPMGVGTEDLSGRERGVVPRSLRIQDRSPRARITALGEELCTTAMS